VGSQNDYSTDPHLEERIGDGKGHIQQVLLPDSE